MRTPEEIAGAVLDAKARLNGYEDWTTDMVESAVVAAAREAQREALSPGAGHEPGCYPDPAHPGYWMCTGEGHPQGPVEPRFAPEGVPDEFRDAFEVMDNGDDEVLWGVNFSGPKMDVEYEFTRSEAQCILAYLSEQHR